MPSHKSAFAILLLACLAVAAILAPANAAPATELHYSVLSAVPTVTHDAVSAVDTTVLAAAPLTGHYKPTNGNPKATARVRLSNSGATCTLTAYLWHKDAEDVWTMLGQHDAALTADTQDSDSSPDAAAYFTTTMPEFDTRGANYIEIRLTALSAGSITIHPWCYGSKTGRE